MKLRTKLIFTMVITSGALTASLTLLASFMIQDQMRAASIAAAKEKAQLFDQAVELFLKGEQGNIALAASQLPGLESPAGLTNYTLTKTATMPVESRLLPKEALIHRLFSQFLKADNSLEQLEVGLTDGSYLGVPLSTRSAGYDPRKRPWYTGALTLSSDSGFLAARQTSDGKIVLPLVKKLTDPQGKLQGVLSVSIGLTEFSELVASIRLGGTGFLMVRESGGNFLASPRDKSLLFKKVEDFPEGVLKANILKADDSPEFLDAGRLFELVRAPAPSIHGEFLLFIDRSQEQVVVGKTILLIGLMGLFFLILVVVVAIVLANQMVKPIHAMVEAIKKTASGDLTVTLEATTRDEIGEAVKDFSALLTVLTGVVGGIQMAAQELVAIGSTLSATSEESAAAIEEMSATSGHVAQFAREQTTHTLDSGAAVMSVLEEIQRADLLCRGMVEQFARFRQSMEANRRGIQSVSAEAKNTDELAEKLTQTGEAGQEVLDHLTTAIAEVVKSADEIQEIVQIILDIASQTNILSMNAAIEAAHAGEAGKGFAVVADEIRKLAETSSSQGQNIKKLLSGIGSAVDRTLSQSQATRERFEELKRDIASVRQSSQAIARQMNAQQAEDVRLSEGMEEVNRFSEQLGAALAQQIQESRAVKESLHQIEDSSRSISQSMQEQKTGMEQSAEAVIQVRETAISLAAVIDQLAQQTQKFKLEP